MQRPQSASQVGATTVVTTVTRDLDLLASLLSTPPTGDDMLLVGLLAEVPAEPAPPRQRVAVTPPMAAPRLTTRRLVARTHRPAFSTGRLALRSLQLAGAVILAGGVLLAGASPLQVRAASSVAAPVAATSLSRVTGLAARMLMVGGAEPLVATPRATRSATLARLPDFELNPAAESVAAARPASLADRKPATVAEYRPASIVLPMIDYSTAAVEVLPPTPYPEDAPPPPAPPEQQPAAAAQPAATSSRPATARPATARPATRQTRPAVLGSTYVVRPGDYLRLISQWYYGNERYWPTIWDNNYKVIGSNPDLIYPGQRYQIPARAGSATPRPAALRPITGLYVVRPGDTLSSIALARYGNANLWTKIYWANAAQIGPDPGYILDGSTLVIP